MAIVGVKGLTVSLLYQGTAPVEKWFYC